MSLVFVLKSLKLIINLKKIDLSGYYTDAVVVIKRRITRIWSTEYSKYYASQRVEFRQFPRGA